MSLVRALRFRSWRVTYLLLFVLALSKGRGQSIVNGNFESGSTGWSGCTHEIGTLATYGGSGSGNVAEVDGNFDASASDDRILCQTISGFTVGSVYSITFDATRRGNGTPPNPVVCTMTIDGGALSRTISRSGGWSMVRETFHFQATRTTHSLRITPNFTHSYGMIFDNLVLAVASPLPVELVLFEANPRAGLVDVSWVTASERDNAYFAVERSADGQAFEEVARTPSLGNSSTTRRYGATDRFPLKGLSYYRLRQVDLDGTTTFSEVVPVESISAFEHPAVLYPNPATGGPVWLDLSGSTATEAVALSVIDATGRTLLSRSLPSGTGLLDLSGMVDFGPGLYLISVGTTGGWETLRLVVQD